MACPRAGGHTIFLGMAAGVGKTYRMLQEGRAELEAGRDVVIGVLETHGRAETAALADGLEVLPRRRLDYRGTTLEEMDLPAILARAPEVCLIDELAHSNAPGAEHAKRFEDIEAVLDAGIDVLSTVNIQHLESLNDRVAELSGVRVRETIPDDVLGRADEIVLIDLSPEALLARLRAGKIYPAERIEASLNGFFRIENLSALREVALREVAEESESRRLESPAVGGARRRGLGGDVRRRRRARSRERLLALVEPVPSAQRLVRRAWRSAQRLGAQLDLLWVAPPGAPAPTPSRSASSRRCASSPRCSARGCSSRRARTSRRRSRGSPAGQGHDVHPARPLAPRARLRAAARRRCPSGSWTRCRASTCGSSPTARAGPEDAAMSAALTIAVAAAGCVGGGAAGWRLRGAPAGTRAATARDGHAADPAAVRRHLDLAPLARGGGAPRSAEGATIMPTYLARVPRHLPLDAPLPAQCLSVMPLLEAIEQRALAHRASPSTRASAAGARIATRYATSSTRSTSTASSCRRRPTSGPASTAPTCSGC